MVMLSTNNLLLQTSSKNLFVHSEKKDTLLIRCMKHNFSKLAIERAWQATVSMVKIQSLIKQAQ